MPTIVSTTFQSGTVTFVKRPGAILETGSLIARMTLDDPDQCKTFQVYSGFSFF
jgi:acetyl-CoA carboxylase/biotin carboxylase 1